MALVLRDADVFVSNLMPAPHISTETALNALEFLVNHPLVVPYTRNNAAALCTVHLVKDAQGCFTKASLEVFFHLVLNISVARLNPVPSNVLAFLFGVILLHVPADTWVPSNYASTTAAVMGGPSLGLSAVNTTLFDSHPIGDMVRTAVADEEEKARLQADAAKAAAAIVAAAELAKTQAKLLAAANAKAAAATAKAAGKKRSRPDSGEEEDDDDEDDDEEDDDAGSGKKGELARLRDQMEAMQDQLRSGTSSLSHPVLLQLCRAVAFLCPGTAAAMWIPLRALADEVLTARQLPCSFNISANGAKRWTAWRTQLLGLYDRLPVHPPATGELPVLLPSIAAIIGDAATLSHALESSFYNPKAKFPKHKLTKVSRSNPFIKLMHIGY